MDERGRRIRAARRNGRIWVFLIPGQIRLLRLVSLLCAESAMAGGAPCGVLVGKMTFFDSDRSIAITAHCDQAALDGWGSKAGAASRWTTGNALLPLGERTMAGPGVLSIEILSDGPYLAAD